jgi:hypothetical protein
MQWTERWLLRVIGSDDFTELWSRLSNFTEIQVQRLGASLEEADELHGMRLPVNLILVRSWTALGSTLDTCDLWMC